MNTVRPKKNLGQHFLRDQNIARKIVGNLSAGASDVIELGPGMGVLTRFLLEHEEFNLHVIEVDRESVEYLKKNFPELNGRIHEADFLNCDLDKIAGNGFKLIGNFPYNISSQVFFKVLENKDITQECVCMVQKEVADRICAGPNSKTYGILSVLLQAFYQIENLFTVPPQVFIPPPKVKSAVIRLTRNNLKELPCNEKLFFKVVKTAFNQRRKMLRNSLSAVSKDLPAGFAEKRPEQLSVESFIELTSFIEEFEN
jgi:16S rRNA (adenine1518-N6/adenine1519-N6)-dimethyltransferase